MLSLKVGDLIAYYGRKATVVSVGDDIARQFAVILLEENVRSKEKLERIRTMQGEFGHPQGHKKAFIAHEGIKKWKKE